MRVPFGGRIVSLDRSTSALDEYAVRVYDGYHRLLAENAFIDGDDRVTANLPCPGDYYVQVEATTATAGDTYALDLTVTEPFAGGGTPVAPDPGPQPPETGIFNKTEGFATRPGTAAWLRGRRPSRLPPASAGGQYTIDLFVQLDTPSLP